MGSSLGINHIHPLSSRHHMIKGRACPLSAAVATKNTRCSFSQAMCCSERHSKVFPMRWTAMDSNSALWFVVERHESVQMALFFVPWACKTCVRPERPTSFKSWRSSCCLQSVPEKNSSRHLHDCFQVIIRKSE